MTCSYGFVSVVCVWAAVVLATPAAAPQERPPTAGAVFRECDACPEMVVMPGGWLALGRYEVTVGEYGAFASAAGGGAGGGCYVATSTGWRPDGPATWRSPGFPQSDRHPVVCVSWLDAQQYASWLSRTTGATYRLPSEGEWGQAASGSGGGCGANGGDADLMPYLNQRIGGNWAFPDGDGPSCARSDGSWFTAPVGSYGYSRLGLADMVGNVWEWMDARGVFRGGSWGTGTEDLHPDARNTHQPGDRLSNVGLRVARTLIGLDPSPANRDRPAEDPGTARGFRGTQLTPLATAP